MKAKSSAHYQREYRRRLRAAGLVKKEVWILPENAQQLTRIEKHLRIRQAEPKFFSKPTGEQSMTNPQAWSTETLQKALAAEALFSSGKASLELIGGVDSTLHLVMVEYGDLPLYLSVVGDQILVEAILWSTADVNDIAGFNDAVLRTHKYFPLSTISLDTMADGEDYYHMFGALSSTSILPNIIFEIETLTANVIQATQAYSEFLTNAQEA